MQQCLVLDLSHYKYLKDLFLLALALKMYHVS